MESNENSERVLTGAEAFAVAFEFLQLYFDEVPSTEVRDLLSEMSPAYGGQSSDPGAWHDWQQAIENMVAKGNAAPPAGHITPRGRALDEREAFRAMTLFLWQFANRAGDDLVTLLGDIEIRPDGGTNDPAAWDDWLDCVAKVRTEGSQS